MRRLFQIIIMKKLGKMLQNKEEVKESNKSQIINSKMF